MLAWVEGAEVVEMFRIVCEGAEVRGAVSIGRIIPAGYDAVFLLGQP